VFSVGVPVVGAPWGLLTEAGEHHGAPPPCIARAVLDIEGSPAEVVWLAT
jgi:hypothetical protein